MNVLVKKEIRLLLPSWIVATLLALPPACTRSDDGIPVFVLFLGLTMMALTSIGRETSLNTFSSLLSQPTERIALWRTKLSVLAGAFLVVFVVWRLAIIFSFKDYHGGVADPETSAAVLIAGSLVFVSTFTGGLWASLLLRQIAGAFWLTLLVPAVLAGFTAAVLAKDHSDYTVITVLCVVLGIYSVGGFLFARWLFFRAQDVGWTGGIIALPEWKFFAAGSNATDSTRKRKPVFALVKKEFQLQQASLMGAAELLVLHVGVIAWRSHHQFARDSAGEILTSIFWMLWLVLPVMMGGMAVAEERRLGVMEGQLCLPASRRVQFIIKGFLAVLLGTLLGGVIPMLLETVARNQIFRSVNHPEVFAAVSIQLSIVAFAAWLALASFFASSLARNFLQAVGYTMATCIGSILLSSALASGRMIFFDSIPEHSLLPVFIAVPTVIVTLPWLAYLNFKNFLDGWPLWRRNLLGLAGAMVVIAVTSTALYNRVWEIFKPVEPPHGAARLSLAKPPTLQDEASNNLLVRLADGCVWLDFLNYPIYDSETTQIKRLLRLVIDPLPKSSGALWPAPGSNWVAATARHVDFYQESEESGRKTQNHVVGYLGMVGIQADGTLWISDASTNGIWTGDKMSRFGNETNWQQVVRSYAGILLLKNDGTLWRWGTNRFAWTNWQQNWPSLRASQPQQIGTDSNWKEIYGYRHVLVKKTDGSVWSADLKDEHWKDAFLRETNLDQISFRTLMTAGDNGDMAYIRPDGTLWMKWQYPQNRTNADSGFIQAGTETNWTTVTLTWNKMVALKSDGSLWQWDFHRWQNGNQGNLFQLIQNPPARVGIHSDWVAITQTWDDVIALSADGSLWLWPDREQIEQYTLLRLPKQPKFLGNIFGKAE